MVCTCLFDFVYGFSALLFTCGDEINDYKQTNQSKNSWINDQLGLFTFAISGSAFIEVHLLLALGWSLGYRFCWRWLCCEHATFDMGTQDKLLGCYFG